MRPIKVRSKADGRNSQLHLPNHPNPKPPHSIGYILRRLSNLAYMKQVNLENSTW